jgi:hypothetical protein
MVQLWGRSDGTPEPPGCSGSDLLIWRLGAGWWKFHRLLANAVAFSPIMVYYSKELSV